MNTLQFVRQKRRMGGDRFTIFYATMETVAVAHLVNGTMKKLMLSKRGTGERKMINLNEVLQEIMLRLVDIIIQGGKQPEKIIVSDRVYELLKGIMLMPRSVQFIDNVFYIADIPVEKGTIPQREDGVWFRIV